MRNLFNRKEFKNIKLETYSKMYNLNNKLYESMDMSNKTGFSDSLIGRAINKIFSAIATQIYMVILRQLKVRLDEEYLKGVLKAMSTYDITLEESGNQLATIEFQLVNKTDDTDTIDALFDGDTYTFEIPKNHNLTEYKTKISSKEKSTWKIDGQDIEQLEDLKENFNVDVTSEGGVEKTYAVIITLEGQKSPDTTLNISLFNTETNDVKAAIVNGNKVTFEVETMDRYVLRDDNLNPTPKTLVFSNGDYVEITDEIKLEKTMKLKVTAEDEKTVKEYEVTINEVEKGGLPATVNKEETGVVKIGIIDTLDIKRQIEQIQKFTDSYDITCAGENDYGLMLKIADEYVKQEVELLNKFSENLSKTTNDSEEVVEWKKSTEVYKERVVELSNVTTKLKDKSNSIDEEKKKELSSDDVKNIVEKPVKKTMNVAEGEAYFKKIENKLSELEKKDPKKHKRLKSAKRKLYMKIHPDKAIDVTDEERAKAAEEFDNILNSILNEYKNYSINSEMIIESYIRKAENMFDDDKYEMINESKVSVMFKDQKELSEKYGDIDLNRVAPDSMVLHFQKNPDLIQKAIDSVDKEAVKGIALEAAWLYDLEKYEDKRNSHYTRINMTTTPIDQKKLENMWKKLITKSKSAYVNFFSRTNDFPKALDPIALMNSDEEFRKNYKQYGEVDKPGGPGGRQNGKRNNTPFDADVLKKLKIDPTRDKLTHNTYGLLSFYTSDDKQYSMIVHKIIHDEVHIYKFVGLYDGFEEIYNFAKTENDEAKIKEFIKEHNYSNETLIKKIQDGNKKSATLSVYESFRPQKKLILDHLYTKGNDNKLVTYFAYKTDANSGPKNMFQLNLTFNAKTTPDDKKVFLSKIDKNKMKILSFDDVSGTLKDRTQYQFNIDFEDIFLFKPGQDMLNLWLDPTIGQIMNQGDEEKRSLKITEIEEPLFQKIKKIVRN